MSDSASNSNSVPEMWTPARIKRRRVPVEVIDCREEVIRVPEVGVDLNPPPQMMRVSNLQTHF